MSASYDGKLRTLWERWLGELPAPCTLSSLRSHVRSGEAQVPSPLRPLVWKLLFGVVTDLRPSAASWRRDIEPLRRDYALLKDKLVTQPRLELEASDSANVVVFNPLSLEDNSPWNRHFKDKELRKLIQQDVERTFPEFDYFRAERVQHILVDILFIYCRVHPELSYRQGMHELLAPFLFVLDECALTQPSIADEDFDMNNADHQLCCLMDSAYVEHDAYILFTRLMQVTAVWFDVGVPQPPVKPATKPPKQKQLDPTGLLLPESTTDNNGTELVHTEMMRKCHHIQNHLLKRIDPALWSTLNGLGIEPQLFGIRWLRLLFGREFLFGDLLLLWDAIFADDSHTLALVDWIGVALLCSMRSDLMERDFSLCLHRLMRPPTSADPLAFVHEAIRLRDLYGMDNGSGDNGVTDDPVVEDGSVLVTSPVGVPMGSTYAPQSAPAATATTGRQRHTFFDDMKKTLAPVLFGSSAAGSLSANGTSSSTFRRSASRSQSATGKSLSKSSSETDGRRLEEITQSLKQIGSQLGVELDQLRSAVTAISATRTSIEAFNSKIETVKVESDSENTAALPVDELRGAHSIISDSIVALLRIQKTVMDLAGNQHDNLRTANVETSDNSGQSLLHAANNSRPHADRLSTLLPVKSSAAVTTGGATIFDSKPAVADKGVRHGKLKSHLNGLL